MAETATKKPAKSDKILPRLKVQYQTKLVK